MILKSKRITLEPLEDKEYVIDLANKDNKREFNPDDTRAFVEEFGIAFWSIMIGGKRRGVIGYFIIQGYVVMEALKDHSTGPTGIGISLEVGNLFLDYLFGFTDTVRTCARTTDRAIQILIEKLGFRRIDTNNNLIIYEKGR